MSERPSLEKQAEAHLKQALEADSSEEKDFHIRSALQFGVSIEAEQAKHVETD